MLLAEVEWEVFSVLQPLEAKGWLEQNEAGFVLTAQGYENLAVNLTKILAYIEEANALIARYEQERREHNESIEEPDDR